MAWKQNQLMVGLETTVTYNGIWVLAMKVKTACKPKLWGHRGAVSNSPKLVCSKLTEQMCREKGKRGKERQVGPARFLSFLFPSQVPQFSFIACGVRVM